jgi:hypothetical protein
MKRGKKKKGNENDMMVTQEASKAEKGPKRQERKSLIT